MLLNLGYMPTITKATRITDYSCALIDHIYSNTPQKMLKSGICLADFSDHLLCFCTIMTKLSLYLQDRYYRNFSKFDNGLFEADLDAIDFQTISNCNDIKRNMENIINMLQEVTNRHAPIKKIIKFQEKTIT